MTSTFGPVSVRVVFDSDRIRDVILPSVSLRDGLSRERILVEVERAVHAVEPRATVALHDGTIRASVDGLTVATGTIITKDAT